MQVAPVNVPKVIETKVKKAKRATETTLKNKKNIWGLEALGHPDDFESPKMWLADNAKVILEKDSSLNPIDVFNKLMDFYSDKYVSEAKKKGDSIETIDFPNNNPIAYSELNVFDQPEKKLVDFTKLQENNVFEMDNDPYLAMFYNRSPKKLAVHKTEEIDIVDSSNTAFRLRSPSDIFDFNIPSVNFFEEKEPLIETRTFSMEISSIKEKEPVFKVPDLPVRRKRQNPEVNEETVEKMQSVEDSAPEEASQLIKKALVSDVSLNEPIHSMSQEGVSTDSLTSSKRGRGRPKGSKNRPKEERPVKVAKLEVEEGVSKKKKSVFSWANLLTMGLLNSPGGIALVKTLYEFIQFHFPSNAPLAENGKTVSWKYTLRHCLTEANGFMKQEHPLEKKSSGYWMIRPEKRQELIADCFAKAENVKNDVQQLKMRHPERLLQILNGTAGIPTNLEIYEFNGGTYKVKEGSSYGESQEQVNQQFQIPQEIPWHQEEQRPILQAQVGHPTQQFPQVCQPTPWYAPENPVPLQMSIGQHQHHNSNHIYSNPNTPPHQDQFVNLTNNQYPPQNWYQRSFRSFNPMSVPSHLHQKNPPHPSYYSNPQEIGHLIPGPSNVHHSYGNQSLPNYSNNPTEVATGDYGIPPHDPTEQQAFNEQQGQAREELFEQNRFYTEMTDPIYAAETLEDFPSSTTVPPRAQSVEPNNLFNNNNININNNNFDNTNIHNFDNIQF